MFQSSEIDDLCDWLQVMRSLASEARTDYLCA